MSRDYIQRANHFDLIKVLNSAAATCAYTHRATYSYTVVASTEPSTCDKTRRNGNTTWTEKEQKGLNKKGVRGEEGRSKTRERERERKKERKKDGSRGISVPVQPSSTALRTLNIHDTGPHIWAIVLCSGVEIP